MNKSNSVGLLPLFIALFISGCINALHDTDGHCDLHKVKMHKRVAWVAYGMPVFSKGDTFPNNKSPIQGGCIPRMEKIGVKYVCKKCTKEHRNACKRK